MWRWVLPVAAVAAVLIGFLASRNGPTEHVKPHAAPTTSAPVTTPGPHLKTVCGSLKGTPRIRHVVWIWMGDQSYKHLIGKTRVAPYINQLASICGVASGYTTITHPSIANDVGVLAGDPHGLVHNACDPCTTTAPSLLTQVPSWRAFVDGMPTPCRKLAAEHAGYTRLSNPPTYFAVRGCTRFDRPLGTPAAGGLARLLRTNTLPAFTLMAPDSCHSSGFDKHCGGTLERGVFISRADVWLRGWLAALTRSRAYQSGATAIFITWNQGTPAQPLHTDCTRAAPIGTCRVPLIVVSPYTTPHTRATLHLTHYSLLGATERLLHARSLLGHASHASAAKLLRAFGL